MYTRELVKTLSNAVAVSGHEFTFSQTIKDEFLKLCHHVEQDVMGNTIGIKKSKKENALKVMLAAHMDEIGLMVKDIDENGFISFTNVGGIDHRILPAQEVIVHGREDLFGIIGAKPPHLQSPEESRKALKMEEMSIDTGFKAEKVKELVSIGDTITIHSTATDMKNNLLSGKCLDDRAGLAILLECLKELEKIELDVDLYAAATVQEEVGLRGAIVSSYHINPDIGIAIDVCHGDTPDTSKEDGYPLGKGPVVTLGPNIHPKLVKRLLEVAREYNIPHQTEVSAGHTGTDAWAIQVTRSGIPTLLLSMPVRYMHTTVETLHCDDLKNAGKLLAFFIKQLEGDLEELLCY